ncbi:MAG: hypothetical protein EHM93_06405 [Bacteroidales bacterium]|nr:MAG: hypothetical protein EHM93_06405 [Bacteroidales bacterium]
MKALKDRHKKSYNNLGLVMLILIFAVALIGLSCQRKVGVKPGGQLKTDKSKCKCKTKKGGVYADSNVHKSLYFGFNGLTETWTLKG